MGAFFGNIGKCSLVPAMENSEIKVNILGGKPVVNGVDFPLGEEASQISCANFLWNGCEVHHRRVAKGLADHGCYLQKSEPTQQKVEFNKIGMVNLLSSSSSPSKADEKVNGSVDLSEICFDVSVGPHEDCEDAAEGPTCQCEYDEQRALKAKYERARDEEERSEEDEQSSDDVEDCSDDIEDGDSARKIIGNSGKNLKVLLHFDDAPEHLRFNRFIITGYRPSLPNRMCFESLFWFTNEAINIWSHVFGWLLFLLLMFYDLFLLNFHATLVDKFVVGGLLVCFQFCMITSVLYHVLSCHSREHYDCFLKYDLFGIACSLLAIYLSGVYYAFWCHREWCIFYVSTVFLIFTAVVIIQRKSNNQLHKIMSFVGWAAYGVVPTIHWAIMMGGWDNPMVEKLLPRVINMYLISGSAFGFYMSCIPERFFPGRFDYVGASHQVWHIFVVIALYYWHNTGIYYIEYRMNHGCLPLSIY